MIGHHVKRARQQRREAIKDELATFMDLQRKRIQRQLAFERYVAEPYEIKGQRYVYTDNDEFESLFYR